MAAILDAMSGLWVLIELAIGFSDCPQPAKDILLVAVVVVAVILGVRG